MKSHFGLLCFFIQGHIGEALDEFHQAMRSAAEQQEIALICQYEIGQRVLEVFCNHIFFVIGLEIVKHLTCFTVFITCNVLRPIRIRLSSCHPIVSVCHFSRVLPFLPRLSLFPRFVIFPAFCRISRALSLFFRFISPALFIFPHLVTFPAFVTRPTLCHFFHSFHRMIDNKSYLM